MEVIGAPAKCIICTSEWVTEIEKKYRYNKHKISPIARDYTEKFKLSEISMRKYLTLHFHNLHRKRGVTKMLREEQVVGDLQDENVDFDGYKDAALKKAMVNLKDPTMKVRPMDVAALENVTINRAKVGVEEKMLKLRMASLYGGFIDPANTTEGEVIEDDKSTAVQPVNP